MNSDIIRAAIDRIGELLAITSDLYMNKRWVRIIAYCRLMRVNLDTLEAMAMAMVEGERNAPPTDPGLR